MMIFRSTGLGQRWRYWLLATMTALLLLWGNGTIALAQRAGQFRVEYGPIENPDYREIRQIIRDAHLYENIAQGLNQTFKLPFDLTITPSTCGAANAFYRPSDKRLIMCDELLGHFAQLFAGEAKSDEDLGESMLYTNLFVFFHELGHGLIDLYDLPTVGREEDAVDEFSTLLLLEAGDAGTKAVMKAAEWFTLESRQQDSTELAFWDEHSLDLQRFYGVACLMYGKDPKKFAGLVTEGILPESRADRCPAEYAKKHSSWDKLLSPFSKGAI
jgi:Putative metallopeptidase